ncbi:MAG: A24 family peptidase [Motiliproteus sp.]|nr:A24 family peptidase [Motiliproteus sp.]MCW9052246.1 A24 family peptidase [Motiliproteus sp.]
MTLFELIAGHPWLATILALLLGLMVGSFLNVVIYRLPEMMSREWNLQCKELLEVESNTPEVDLPEKFNLAVPASTCPKCGHKIRAYENIPVLSYLFLKGRCSSCKTSISIRYPLVELVTGLLSAYVIYSMGLSIASASIVLMTWVLITLTMIDYDHQLLPDNLTLPLLWLGLILNSQGLFTDLQSALWGAVFGYLSLWSVYWAFKLLTGKEGMGFGDFKLLAALGAWMGWQLLPLIVILSSVVGAIIGIAMILFKGREQGQPMPFGPFLAIAGWIAMLWGEQITSTYLQLIGLS